MKKTAQILAPVLMLASLAAAAAGKAPPPDSIPAPDGAPGAGGGIEEPSITIRSKNGQRIEEYRLRGKLYMVRVTPPKGKPYYLVDQTGRGEFTRHEGPAAPTAVPQWVLHSF